MALTLPPEADQHWSKISPLAASETFTQRRRRRIGAGSLHANGSVNGASDEDGAANRERPVGSDENGLIRRG